MSEVMHGTPIDKPEGQIRPLGGYGIIDLLDTTGNVRPMEELEREIFNFAIRHHQGQLSEVARRLQVSRSTVYRRFGAKY